MKQAKTPAPRRVRAAAVMTAGPRYARRIMVAQWGAPCPEFAAGCACCDAWQLFNATRGRTAPRWDVLLPSAAKPGAWNAAVGGLRSRRWTRADVLAMWQDVREWAAL